MVPLSTRPAQNTPLNTWNYEPTILNSLLEGHNWFLSQFVAVLRIRDVYPISRIRIFLSRIQGQKHSESRIRICIKEFIKYRWFNPKKWFSAFGNMIRDGHPGSESWFFTHPGPRISDPGVKKAPDTGSGSATPVLSRFFGDQSLSASFLFWKKPVQTSPPFEISCSWPPSQISFLSQVWLLLQT